MKICISSGHGKLIRGAAGPSPWGLDEVDEARKIVDKVAEYLAASGVGVEVFHDNVSTTQGENLDRICLAHNAATRDLDVSVHLNCYDGTANGCEVLYVSQHDLAEKVADEICAASGLKNRGPKKRTDLKFLNATEEPAILIETCFVDSQADADIYNQHFLAICRAITEAISGQEMELPEAPPPTTTEPVKPTVVITVHAGKEVTFTVEPPGSVTVTVVHIT